VGERRQEVEVVAGVEVGMGKVNGLCVDGRVTIDVGDGGERGSNEAKRIKEGKEENKGQEEERGGESEEKRKGGRWM